LETGIESVDKRNIDIFTQLDDLANIRHEQRKVLQMLDNLEEFVKKNFSMEENLHEALDFPDAYLHKSHHKKYIVTLHRFRARYLENGATLANVIDFEKNVIEMLKHHIACYDMHFAMYYRSRVTSSRLWTPLFAETGR
jgi:hemerythrin-like metal-binding protein